MDSMMLPDYGGYIVAQLSYDSDQGRSLCHVFRFYDSDVGKGYCSGETDDLAHVSSAECLCIDLSDKIISEIRCVIESSAVRDASKPRHASSIQVLVKTQGILI